MIDCSPLSFVCVLALILGWVLRVRFLRFGKIVLLNIFVIPYAVILFSANYPNKYT